MWHWEPATVKAHERGRSRKSWGNPMWPIATQVFRTSWFSCRAAQYTSVTRRRRCIVAPEWGESETMPHSRPRRGRTSRQVFRIGRDAGFFQECGQFFDERSVVPRVPSLACCRNRVGSGMSGGRSRQSGDIEHGLHAVKIAQRGPSIPHLWGFQWFEAHER